MLEHEYHIPGEWAIKLQHDASNSEIGTLASSTNDLTHERRQDKRNRENELRANNHGTSHQRSMSNSTGRTQPTSSVLSNLTSVVDSVTGSLLKFPSNWLSSKSNTADSSKHGHGIQGSPRTDLQIEDATADGQTFPDTTSPPATAKQPIFSPNITSSPTEANFSALPPPSPSLSYQEAEADPIVDPLTFHAVSRKQSHADAIKLVRDRNLSRPKSPRLPDRPQLSRLEISSNSIQQASLSVSSPRARQTSGSTLKPNPEDELTPRPPFTPEALAPVIKIKSEAETYDVLQSVIPTQTQEPIETPNRPKKRNSLFKKLGRGSTKSTSRESSSASLPPISSSLPKLSTSSRLPIPVVSLPKSSSITSSLSEMASGYDESQPRLPGRVRNIKVRTKHKTEKYFDKLFLAQEIRVPHISDPPTSRFMRSSSMGSSNSNSYTPSLVSESPISPFDYQSTHPQSDPPPSAVSTATSTRKNAIWCCKFSLDGNYLAVAGRDGVVRVYQVISGRSQREQAHEAEDLLSASTPISPACANAKKAKNKPALAPVLVPTPLHEFRGHTALVLDLCWSKNNFLLSSSMDKTVRLWHISRPNCLCAFQHPDFVTSVAFHPKDDRYFLSGSLDCKLRLWDIPKKSVHASVDTPELITCVEFTNDAKHAIAGTFAGQVMFFNIHDLTYSHKITVKSTKTKGKGAKITSVSSLPGNWQGPERLLVTSNDSRLRMYSLADKNLEAKYKGHENVTSQIRGSFSDDGNFIVSGAEDGHVYIWDSGIAKSELVNMPAFLRKPEKTGVEFFSVPADIVTCAIFAPQSTLITLSRSGDPLLEGRPPLQPTSSNASNKRQSKTFSPRANSDSSIPNENPARDAIIITADSSSHTLRIYRNSVYPSTDYPPSLVSTRRASQNSKQSKSPSNNEYHPLPPAFMDKIRQGSFRSEKGVEVLR